MNDKIIEEMARVICPNSNEWTCKACNWGRKHDCDAYKNAEKLINEGYRNCKDKVVLSKEEYEKLQNKLERYSKEREFVGKCLTDATLRCVELTNDFNDMLDSIYNLAREKTVKEIFYKLKETLIINNEENTEFFDYDYTLETIDKLAKQFGVVEE